MSVTHNAYEVANALRAEARAVERRVTSAVQRGARAVQRHAKANASGRPGLRMRTPGGFRAKIETDPKPTKSGGRIETHVGTNRVDAAYHEFGFVGPVQVRAHTRNINGKVVNVRAHTRHVNYAGYPVFGPAVDSAEEEVVAIIRKALVPA